MARQLARGSLIQYCPFKLVGALAASRFDTKTARKVSHSQPLHSSPGGIARDGSLHRGGAAS